MKKLAVVLVALLLFGCSAAGVMSTNDPKRKLSNAMQLLNNNRPIPAQRLILQTMTHYQKSNDEVGIAHAHKAYGQFYMSKAYHANKEYFQKYNEYDGTYEKAVISYKKSLDLFTKNKEYFEASNSAWNLAGSYQYQKNKPQACEAFDLSLTLHKKGKKLFPNKTTSLPPGFTSMDDVVSTFKKNYGC